MAKCRYCGKWAGLFQAVHPGCGDAHKRQEGERVARESVETRAVEQLRAVLISLPLKATAGDEIAASLDPLAKESRDTLLRAVAAWLCYLVKEMGSDGVSQEQVEATVRLVLDRYGIDPTGLADRAWGKFVRACACGDLARGVLPSRVKIASDLPFNFEAGEITVWAFPGAEYLEDKTVRSPSRGYAGVSVRVVPGVYAHMGESRPTDISEGFFSIDKGLLVLTDRAILFSGAHKALRIKYKEIVSFTRFDYGFAVCKGNQTARNQGFEIQDDLPGFPFVLIEGLAKLKAAGKT